MLLFNVGAPTKLVVGSVLALTIASPVAGFLATIASVPFGHLLALGVTVENFRMSEAITLAFFVGWLLHGWTDRVGPRMPRLVAPLLAGVIVASVVGLAWQLSRYPGELPHDLVLLFQAYNLAADRIGAVAAARLLEGLALAAATVTLFRSRPRLAVVVPAVLAGVGCAAACASWLLWYGIAPQPILRAHALNGYRVAAHVIDPNAAGSYFAMLVCLAVGMAWRARGRSRVIWLAIAAVLASGVWLSASRSAQAAAVIATTGLLAWCVAARFRSRTVAFNGLAVVVVIAIAGGAALWTMSRNQLSRGTSYRVQFNETSRRMIASRPIIGVGIGQYHIQSALFLSPELAWQYGHENAHNYFLQAGAELGLPGLALFTLLFAGALWRAGRAAVARPEDARLVGLTCGIGAWLMTALVGHPFLVDEVALPFWAQFGLLIGLSAAVSGAETRARAGWWNRSLATGFAAVAAAVVLVSAPLRLWRGEVEPLNDPAVTGCYAWETDGEGTRYRWTREYASVFVPADVVHVDLPVRIPEGARGLDQMTIASSVNGRHGPTTLVGTTWSTISVDLPASSAPARFTRVNLRVPHTWRPALYIAGNADMRPVGVEIGEPRLILLR